MSRPLRIQYPDAWYHVMNRGRRGEEIFTGKNDFDTLKGVGKAFGIDKNSIVGSVVERVTREMEKDKNISKRVKNLKDILGKS